MSVKRYASVLAIRLLHLGNVCRLRKLLVGADEEAVAWFRRSIELNRGYLFAHLYLAAALELLDRHAEAQAEAQAALAINPKFTIRRYHASAASDNPVFLKQRERIIHAMQKAGLPEG